MHTHEWYCISSVSRLKKKKIDLPTVPNFEPKGQTNLLSFFKPEIPLSVSSFIFPQVIELAQFPVTVLRGLLRGPLSALAHLSLASSEGGSLLWTRATIYACIKGHLEPTHLKSSPPFTFSTKLLGQDSPSVHLFSITIGSRFTIAKIKFGEDSPSWFVFFSRSRFTFK